MLNLLKNVRITTLDIEEFNGYENDDDDDYDDDDDISERSLYFRFQRWTMKFQEAVG